MDTVDSGNQGAVDEQWRGVVWPNGHEDILAHLVIIENEGPGAGEIVHVGLGTVDDIGGGPISTGVGSDGAVGIGLSAVEATDGKIVVCGGVVEVADGDGGVDRNVSKDN